MENDDRLFDDYLHDRLSGSRRKEFEERLDSDEEFRTEFEAHKLVLGAIYARRDRKLLARIAAKRKTTSRTPANQLPHTLKDVPSIARNKSKVKRKMRVYPYIVSGHRDDIGGLKSLKKKEKKTRRLKAIHYGLMAAASLALIAVIVWMFPFRSGEELVAKGKVRNIPMLVTTEALGFTSTVDSLKIQVNEIRGTSRYEFYDTLKLFLTKDPSGVKIGITYFEDTGKYELTLDDRKYRIRKYGRGFLE